MISGVFKSASATAPHKREQVYLRAGRRIVVDTLSDTISGIHDVGAIASGPVQTAVKKPIVQSAGRDGQLFEEAFPRAFARSDRRNETRYSRPQSIRSRTNHERVGCCRESATPRASGPTSPFSTRCL